MKTFAIDEMLYYELEQALEQRDRFAGAINTVDCLSPAYRLEEVEADSSPLQGASLLARLSSAARAAGVY